MTRGFTLVELAIVLVIIGLLIGGILVAQSMIQTAKIQAFIRQVGQFDVAVANFSTQFNSIPGDSSVFNSSIGNGNGLIEQNATPTGVNEQSKWQGETANFWSELSLVGLKNENGGIYSATYSGTNFPFGANSPKAKLGNGVGFVVAGSASTSSSSQPGNYYIAANWSRTTSATSMMCLGGFSYIESLAVDTKIDDGMSGSGNVIVFPNMGDNTNIINDTPPSWWSSTEDAPIAAIVIRMNSQTGF